MREGSKLLGSSAKYLRGRMPTEQTALTQGHPGSLEALPAHHTLLQHLCQPELAPWEELPPEMTQREAAF